MHECVLKDKYVTQLATLFLFAFHVFHLKTGRAVLQECGV